MVCIYSVEESKYVNNITITTVHNCIYSSMLAFKLWCEIIKWQKLGILNYKCPKL